MNGQQPQRTPLPGTRDVVRHVISCNPCHASVAGLQQSHDVVRQLASPRQDPALLHNVLGQTARVGKSELGTLLYEMGRASLALIPEVVASVDFEQMPDELPVSTKRAKALVCRMPSASLDALPEIGETGPVDRTDAARLSVSFADALLSLEGRRARGLILRGTGMIALRDYEAARTSIEQALAVATTEDCSIAARRNLVHVLFVSADHERAFNVARESVIDHPSDPVLWFNYLASSASLSRSDDIHRACTGLKNALKRAGADSPWWQVNLRSLIEQIARESGRDEDQYLRLLGLESPGGAER